MDEIKDFTFERAFSELEALVQEMEGGDLDLDRALGLYERGMALAAYCDDKLDAAQLRVRQMAPNATSADDESLAPFESLAPPEEGR